MTYEELLNNISKSNYKSSNFRRLVNQFAYSDMVIQHKYCDYLRGQKKVFKEKGIITDGTRIRSNLNSYRTVYFTIYTKIPKYRTYRQQWAITAKQLEKSMKKDLEYKDFIARTRAKEVNNIHGCSLFFIGDELIGDII